MKCRKVHPKVLNTLFANTYLKHYMHNLGFTSMLLFLYKDIFYSVAAEILTFVMKATSCLTVMSVA